MRILYFHQYFSTPDGSTGTRSYQFAINLIKRGHSVTVVCGSNKVSDTGLKIDFNKNFRVGYIDGIKVIEYNLNYSNSNSIFERSIKFIRFALFGIKTLHSEEYDLVFCTSTPLTVGIPGIYAKLFLKKPFVFEVRDLWPELPKALGVIRNPIILKILDILETKIYKNSEFCIGLSPGIIEGIKKKAPEKKVYMIPNGCDLDNNRDVKKLTKNKFIAVFCGAHGFANGLESILDVCKNLKERNVHDIEIQLIGDGALKPKLQKRAAFENLENCLFLDPMPKKTLFDYLKKNADIGLMVLKNIPAFYYGTSPNKFFDYLSLSLPVINNYPGWIADMVNSKKCGLVVPPNDINKFADALIYLKQNRNELKAMSKNSFALATSDFKRQLLADKFAKVFEKNFLNQ